MDINFNSSACIPATLLGLSATDWIALCSAFIALTALRHSIRQGRLQRKHQILSAKPMLEFHVSNGETLLMIRNEGFGPASIVSFTAEIRGQDIDMTTRTGIREFVDAVTVHIDEEYKYERTRFDSGTVFGVGKEVCVVIGPHQLSDANHHKITEGLSCVKLSISYTCIYGETYTKIATFEQVIEADQAHPH